MSYQFVTKDDIPPCDFCDSKVVIRRLIAEVDAMREVAINEIELFGTLKNGESRQAFFNRLYEEKERAVDSAASRILSAKEKKSRMSYQFVTLEDIEKQEYICFDYMESCPKTGVPIAVRDLRNLADRLLSERDAYREMAIHMDDRRTYSIEERRARIDAEASRILSAKEKS